MDKVSSPFSNITSAKEVAMTFPTASLAGLLTSLLILSLVFIYACTSLRVYVRTQKTKNFGVNDGILLCSVVLTTVFGLFTILSTSHGIASTPADQSDPEELSIALRFNFFASQLFIVAVTLLRVAACSFLVSLTTVKIQRTILETSSIVLTTYAVWYFLYLLMQCIPVEYYWDSVLPGFSGGCLDPLSLARQGYMFSFFSGCVDFSLSLMPIWILWEKRLDRKQKYGVAACMASGFLAGTAAILRIPATAMLIHSNDFYYDTVSLLVCCILELGFGSVAVAAAGLRIPPKLVENKEGEAEDGKIDENEPPKEGKRSGNEIKRKELPRREENA